MAVASKWPSRRGHRHIEGGDPAPTLREARSIRVSLEAACGAWAGRPASCLVDHWTARSHDRLLRARPYGQHAVGRGHRWNLGMRPARQACFCAAAAECRWPWPCRGAHHGQPAAALPKRFWCRSLCRADPDPAGATGAPPSHSPKDRRCVCGLASRLRDLLEPIDGAPLVHLGLPAITRGDQVLLSAPVWRHVRQ